jgi:hypothetical protein
LPDELSRLCEGEVVGDDADVGADGRVLALGEALEHEDAAGDVNVDVVALPVGRIDLFTHEAEVAALVDVAEHAEAEVDGLMIVASRVQSLSSGCLSETVPAIA